MSVASLAALASTPTRAALAGASWTFAVRLFVSPALIGLAIAVARRWGPEAGGWFAALPHTSGPVVLVLALEHGPTFAARACVGIVLAIAALAAYVLVYSRASRRLGWPGSAALACAAYLAALWPLGRVRGSLFVAFALACAAVIGTRLLLGHDRERRPPTRPPAWDVPLRMGLAAALVWGLTRLSVVVGPRVSGFLAPFPVVTTILATFAHRHDGPAAARRFLRGLLSGLVSFAVFFLTAGLLLPSSGIAPAFLAATFATLAVHAAAWRLAGRPPAAAPLLLESD
ncbi:MAG TPA: hypothetical protein VF041_00825 [Gemmatimonadaceae bacterium]